MLVNYTNCAGPNVEILKRLEAEEKALRVKIEEIRNAMRKHPPTCARSPEHGEMTIYSDDRLGIDFICWSCNSR